MAVAHRRHCLAGRDRSKPPGVVGPWIAGPRGCVGVGWRFARRSLGRGCVRVWASSRCARRSSSGGSTFRVRACRRRRGTGWAAPQGHSAVSSSAVRGLEEDALGFGFIWHSVVDDRLGDHAHLRPGVLRHFAEHSQGLRRIETEVVHDDVLCLLDEFSRPELTKILAVSHCVYPVCPGAPLSTRAIRSRAVNNYAPPWRGWVGTLHSNFAEGARAGSLSLCVAGGCLAALNCDGGPLLRSRAPLGRTFRDLQRRAAWHPVLQRPSSPRCRTSRDVRRAVWL